MKTVEILDVEIDNISQLELLNNLKFGGVVFTPNVDHIVKLQTDLAFRRAYRFATYRVCDSQILLWTSRLLNQPIREKIAGSDLFPAFYHHYKHDSSVKIFLLGSAPGVAEMARRNINAKVGREMVVGAHSPSFNFLEDAGESEEIVRLIHQSGATVLAVGVGAPKQEKWLFQNRDKLAQIRVAFAVGATIDFEAGHTRRSPAWISHLGLEWMYRLVKEPKRLWKRYLVEDLVFFRLLLSRKLFSRQPNRERQGKSMGKHLEISRNVDVPGGNIQTGKDQPTAVSGQPKARGLPSRQ